jgi:hypothetical protein
MQADQRGLQLLRQPHHLAVEEFVDLVPCALHRHRRRPDQRCAQQQVQQQSALQAHRAAVGADEACCALPSA